MYSYGFSPSGLRSLEKLDPQNQEKILKKLDYFMASEYPLSFAERLVNNEIGQYRFRVGEYRVICDLVGEKIRILAVGHRREIYK